jgi:hypothetical protein
VQLEQALSINDSFFIYKIGIQLQISVSLQYYTCLIISSVKLCPNMLLKIRRSVQFIYILLLYCFGALVLCRLAVRAYRRILQDPTGMRPARVVVALFAGPG